MTFNHKKNVLTLNTVLCGFIVKQKDLALSLGMRLDQMARRKKKTKLAYFHPQTFRFQYRYLKMRDI